MLILLIPIFDTFFVIVLRTLAGRPIAQGGRDHTSHRLVALGMSEREAVWMLYGLAAASGLLSLLIQDLSLAACLGVVLGFVSLPVLLGIYLARVKVYDEAEIHRVGTWISMARTFASNRAKRRFGTFRQARPAADRSSARMGITPAATRFLMRVSSTMNTSWLTGKSVLITGALGTVAGGLLRMVLDGRPKVVRAFDSHEHGLFSLRQRLGDRDDVRWLLGDIRDLDRLRRALEGIDVVFHCAALKHVALGEYNPFEIVQTNLLGLQNVIQAALDNRVDRVVFTSSDKAVNPTNAMWALPS